MSLLNKLTQVAKSKQGQEMLQKAKTFANDPKTREKIEEARGKFTEQVDAAKQKMADKKAKDAGGDTPKYGEPGAPGDAPKYGESTEPATQPASGGQDTGPTGTDGGDGPTYGEEEGAKPLYGEDGPKAA